MNHNNEKGELHRIYWQQWVSSSSTEKNKSRRELITSSAGIRISHSGATAKDVTQLLRATLKLGNDSELNTEQQQADSLVLVGTLYSLSRNYVQFEHEQQHRKLEQTLSSSAAESQSIRSSSSTLSAETDETLPCISSSYSSSTTTTTTTDPYHMVNTLHPKDDPLKVKRRMEERLTAKLQQQQSPVSRTIMSPKLQWFFIPYSSSSNSERESLIPNCVELDGYCSSMEDDDNDNDDDSSLEPDKDEQKASHDDDGSDDGDLTAPSQCSYSNARSPIDDRMQERFPWLQQHSDHQNERVNNNDSLKTVGSAILRRVNKERKRRHLFHKALHATARAQSFKGYLTKQSHHDPHVWRNCFCVITDSHLWYISRIYSHCLENGPIRYSKHGRIQLANALLLEPSPDYTPLFRTPFAFECVTENGRSHVFRATGKTVQSKWIQALSSRIVQSYENSFLDNTEHSLSEETWDRTRRMESAVVEPFAKALLDTRQNALLTLLSTTNMTKMRGHLGALMRWGMQVVAFKELCRYIQSSQPVNSPNISIAVPSRLEGTDSIVESMIEAAWTRAAELLARATHVATQLQPRLSHGIETQCRHIDYMIHGKFRSTSFEDTSRSSLGDHRQRYVDEADTNLATESKGQRDAPPPIDLFDQLLSDLQRLAAKVAIATRETSGNEVR